MKKSELKNGAVLQTANGELYIKIDDTLISFEMNGDFIHLDDLNEDLEAEDAPIYNIVKVHNEPIYHPISNLERSISCKSIIDVLELHHWTWEKDSSSNTEKDMLKQINDAFSDALNKKEGNDESKQQLW